jgi:hypothetical protein
MIEFTIEELQHITIAVDQIVYGEDYKDGVCLVCARVLEKCAKEIERLKNPPLNENGCIEVPVPDKYKALGVTKWEIQPGRHNEEEETKGTPENSHES